MAENKNTQNYDEIFTDDKLNTKSNVVDFAHLIEQDVYKEGESSKVYSISAEFGIGKTFFCDKLQKVLEKDKVKVGKLNIWEMDFYENPLIPILAELNKLYNQKGKRLPAKILDSLDKFSTKSCSALCELVGKIASNELLGVDAIEVFKENFSSKTIYKDYEEYQQALQELKDALKDWSSKQKDKPIVVIIDELDRCKPDYAVKTLEVLKHIFDIPGFVFVLAIDEEQLKNSVQTLFGTINYERYKRKFISNSFQLPEPDRLAFTEYLYDKSGIDGSIKQIQNDKKELVFTVDIYNYFFCAYSYSEYGNRNKQEVVQEFNKLQTSESIIKRYFAAYSECFDFSLRKMEQVFDRLTLFIKQINASKELFSPDLAVFLICIHEGDSKIFNRVSSTKYCNSYIIKELFEHTTLSVAYQIYKDEAFTKFKDINRKIIPKVVPIVSYSYNAVNGTNNRIIEDNIDRFYTSNTNNWLFQQESINTHDVLIPDSNFDKEKFKKSYCKHIDFISHFE